MTPEIKKAVPMSELSPLIVGLIDEGINVTITVTGNSMRPMLTHLKDTVVLTKCNPDDLRVGDIPLYRRDNGNYILHRILKVHNDCFDISGDRQYVLERGVEKNRVCCVVTGFTRNGKYYSCRHFGYRLYALIWRWLFPFRKGIVNVYRKSHRAFTFKKDKI